MRLVIAIPMFQGLVVGVFEDEFEGQGFHMAVAEEQVGFAFVTGEGVFGISSKGIPVRTLKSGMASEVVADGEHLTGSDYFRFTDWWWKNP
jgi:hypothetical protein